VAGLGIDAAFRADQEASRVDDTGDVPFIGVVVERVPPDTPRSGVGPIGIRVWVPRMPSTLVKRSRGVPPPDAADLPIALVRFPTRWRVPDRLLHM
jgi:hypothetical protein